MASQDRSATDAPAFSGHASPSVDLPETLPAGRVHVDEFSAFLHSTACLHWQCAVSGEITLASPGLIQYAGADSPALQNAAATRLVHPDDRDRLYTACQSAASEGTRQTLQIRLLRWDGAYRWFLGHVEPQPAARLTVHLFDVHEQPIGPARSEWASARPNADAPDGLPRPEGEERYRALVEMCPDALFVNRDNAIVYANEAMCRTFGAESAQALLGRSPLSLVAPSSRAVVRERMSALLAGQSVRAIEEIWLRLDGTEIHAEVRAGLCVWQGEPAIQVTLRDTTDRARLAADRDRQSQRLAAICEAVQDGIAVCDPNGGLVYANPAEARLHGFDTPEAMLADPDPIRGNLELTVDGEKVPVNDWPWARALRGETFHDWRVRGRRRDTGQEWDFSFSGAPAYEDGRLMLAVTTTRDITTQTRVEEALRLSEQRFRSLVAATTAIVWTTDAEARFVEPQTSWESATGQPWTAQCARGWLDAVHPDDRAALLRAWTYVRPDKPVPDTEARIWHGASDTYRLYAVRAVPITREGQVREWVAAAVDIDRSRRAERLREEALVLLDTLLNAAPAGFALLDDELRVQRSNGAMAEMAGVPVEQHQGRRLRELLPGIADALENTLMQVIETGKPVINREIVGAVRTPGGAPGCWLHGCYPVLASDGRCLGTGVIIVDVSAMRRAKEEIACLNEQLHRAVVEGYHRQKNQLQQLGAIIQLMLMEDRPLIPVEDVRRLENQVKVIAALHDVMTTNTRQDGACEKLSSQAILERVLPLLQQTSGPGELLYSVEDMPLTLKAATALMLVLNELVTNARKHGGGPVRVSFLREGRLARLRVADNGPGFPATFDPVRSANTGIELIETLAHTDLLGATSYENLQDGGARVTVSFPISSASQNAPMLE